MILKEEGYYEKVLEQEFINKSSNGKMDFKKTIFIGDTLYTDMYFSNQ